MQWGDSMTKRMESKKRENRQSILDAAENIIAEKGFKAMTMDDVAKKADLAKGTLYLYFPNKNSLCAAVNARLNKEINCTIKKKIDSYETGSEKIVACGTGFIEYCKKNPQKCKAGTELYLMPLEDIEDPNVQDFLQEVNKTVQMMVDAYRQGKAEGSILEDVDPVPTAIFVRMGFINAFNPTYEHKLLLKLHGFSEERYFTVAWNLLNRSTHIKQVIIEETEKPLEELRLEETAKEMKDIIKSIDMPVEDAFELYNAFKYVTDIMVGKCEHETVEATEERVINRVHSCPILTSRRETFAPQITSMPEGCSMYGKILIETLNPEYTHRFTKKICEGDPYCESIIELKKTNSIQ